MLPGGDKDGFPEQDQPPAAGDRDHDGRAPPHPPPPSPATEAAAAAAPETKKKQKQDQKQEPLGSLPEGPLMEILSRVPYRSLCRFKCVSKPWLALCSDPAIRKRSPQTLSGFFYMDRRGGLQISFCNLSGRGSPMVDPSLPFLRQSYKQILAEQCSGGLLLCRCWKSANFVPDRFDYVVCNPSTEKWTLLPPIELSPDRNGQNHLCLGFDRDDDPSCFSVFAHPSRIDFQQGFKEVAIYSSKTGRWTSVQSDWRHKTVLSRGVAKPVFLNGTMHLTTLDPSMLTMDREGKVWREIELPRNYGFIGESQGFLHFWHVAYDHQLSVWVLEDYGSGRWTLKHTTNVLELFGRHRHKVGECTYMAFAIHPECNLIFLTDRKEKIVSYDMDSREVHVVCTSGELRMGALPYTPCFVDWSSDGH